MRWEPAGDPSLAGPLEPTVPAFLGRWALGEQGRSCYQAHSKDVHTEAQAGGGLWQAGDCVCGSSDPVSFGQAPHQPKGSQSPGRSAPCTSKNSCRN